MYCKLPTNGKQLPAFPLKAITGIEPRPQRWEARVLPLCHRGPTVVAKEDKAMALQRSIIIHQYLDDWLVRASSHETCLQHTQIWVVLCQDLGWLVNKEKSELAPTRGSPVPDPHLDEHTGTWSLPESKLHINHLELKAVFLALKEFQTICCNKTVLTATDNTTVVACINKGGGG